MTRKSGRNRRTGKVSLPGSADELLAIAPLGEFNFALEGLINCQGPSDYLDMPEMGRWITALNELVKANESEDMAHYFLYAEDRWQDAAVFLRHIGAQKSAEIFAKVIDLFPGGIVPKLAGDRLKALENIEADAILSSQIDGLSDDWQTTGEDIQALVREYVTIHRDNLEELLTHRIHKIEYLKYNRALSDDDIVRLAYRSENDPFEGLKSNLLDGERLPLLMSLAADAKCPTRMIFICVLYAICGNVGSQIVAGKMPPDLSKLQDAIREAKRSGDSLLREWADRSEAFLVKPTPDIILSWMGAIF
jgi:hypothetical protein